MAGIDKAAIAWTIAIVVAGTGIAAVGPGFESGSESATTTPSMTDDKIAAAKEAIAKEQAEKMNPTSETKEIVIEESITITEETSPVEEVVEEAPMEEAPVEVVEEVTSEPQTHTVDMPEGAGIPGCEDNNMCFNPTNITINAGDTIVWTNSEEFAPHIVAAGDLKANAEEIGTDFPNGFESELIASGGSFEHTFDTPGEIPYFCTLHPWMVGSIQVN